MTIPKQETFPIPRTQSGDRAAFDELLNTLLLLGDFSNRVHLLLLIMSIAVYTILALSLIALGLHVSRNTLLVLNSIELIGEKREIKNFSAISP